MKLSKSLLLVGVGLILGSTIGINSARADGGIFYPINYPTAETTQKAFIYFTGQTENLVVLTSFQGNAKDFVWVVPTPYKPVISKGNIDLFNTLASITKTADSGPGVVYNAGSGFSAGTKSSPVEVISEKTVDVYDTVVLKATDETALAKWLSDHSYSFPQDKVSDLKGYVDNNWYFAIAKIKPDVVNSGGIVPELNKGTLTPLRLTFQTNKIVYPMKLTGVALTQTSLVTPSLPPNDSPVPPQKFTTTIPITLYVLSDHKTEQSFLSTDWGNWVSNTNIDRLNGDLGANIILHQKLFLTKMIGSANVDNVADDFIITTASDDTVYPTPVYKTAAFWLGNLLFLILVPLMFLFYPVPVGLVFIIFLLCQFYIKKKWLYIFGSIFQILTCLAFLTIGLFILGTNGFDLSGIFLENGFIGAGIAIVALFIICIRITLKMLRRYKTVF